MRQPAGSPHNCASSSDATLGVPPASQSSGSVFRRLTSLTSVNRLESLSDRRQEFESHIWDHAADPFQRSFDTPDELTVDQLHFFDQMVALIGNSKSRKLNLFLVSEFESDPSLLPLTLQLVGLTRNKVLQDLRGELSAAKVSIPSKVEGLFKNSDIWGFAFRYLHSRVRAVLGPLEHLPRKMRHSSLEALNRATWPGWIRQERAKRQGHEAEHRVAKLLAGLGIAFEPLEKMFNPLCKDVRIGGQSFDLVVPNTESPQLCIKSTVHAANPGQYGKAKGTSEIRSARQALLRRKPPRPLLVALVDGVGFKGNMAGLKTILETADEFCQLKTIWKVAVVAAHQTDLVLAVDLKDKRTHKEFLSRYKSTIVLRSLKASSRGVLTAGEARVSLVSPRRRARRQRKR